MRAMLVTAIFLAGCLHTQGPASPRRAADPAALAEFSRLVHDPMKIEAAAAYASAHGLSKEDVSRPAASAYAAYLRAEAYALAAEVAWRFAFKPSAIDVPAALQRKRAAKRVGRYLARRQAPDAVSLRLEARADLRDEALIGCLYSSRPKDRIAAVADVIDFRAAAFDDEVLFPLLDAGCPVTPEWRDLIIEQAFARGMDDYAIRHAAADWTSERKVRFVWGYFNLPRCSVGFRAVSALRIAPLDVIPMVEKSWCEQTRISTDLWSIAREDAGRYFFAAVRHDKINLALALLPFTGFDEDGRIYLFQEVLRHGRGSDLLKLLPYHTGLHDPFMQYAYDQGRYRFVGNYAQTYDWQRKAFDKLLELKKWEDAGEVAQYGMSETLRSEGVPIAFRAAMAAGDFKAGRYFVHRYGPVKDKPGLVTQEMYDAEKDKFYAARQGAGDPDWMKEPTSEPKPNAKPKKRKRQKSACPPDEWCP